MQDLVLKLIKSLHGVESGAAPSSSDINQTVITV